MRCVQFLPGVIFAALSFPAIAAAQTAPVSAPASAAAPSPSAPAAEDNPAPGRRVGSREQGTVSVGDVAEGVFRRPQEGASPVRFLARDGEGREPIGVSSEAEDMAVADFVTACATPCTLWFNHGPHFVALGRSAIRTRVFELQIDERPSEVSFGRDNVFGVGAGIFVAGAGLIAMIIGSALALSNTRTPAIDGDPRGGPPEGWWLMSGGGAVVLLGGGGLMFASFGTSSSRYSDEAGAHERPVRTAHR